MYTTTFSNHTTYEIV